MQRPRQSQQRFRRCRKWKKQYSHSMGLKHPFTTKGMANVFVKEIVKLNEYPKSIVFDRDKVS